MRLVRAAIFAALILALMPAFALLRYEPAQLSVPPFDTPAAAGSASHGPSVWSDLRSHVTAAPSASIYERSVALAALDHVIDSIPRPADAPAPALGRVYDYSHNDRDETSHIALVEILQPCAGIPEGAGCRDRPLITLVRLRVLALERDRASVLVDWSVSPGLGRGGFGVELLRQQDRWLAGVIARIRYPERAGAARTRIPAR